MAFSAPAAIGIMGGTFDPIHNGHLRTALELSQIIDLKQIRFIPCKIPVHKDFTHASSEDRLAMLELAIANQPQFTADDRELRRDSPSYMIETLTSLREEISEPICLILGSDAFLQLPTWHRWEQILNLAHIIVAIRPGQDFAPTGEILQLLDKNQLDDRDGLHENSHGHIFIQSVTQLDISATHIRAQLQAGYSPRYLLPESVLEYIQTKSIYLMR